MELQKKKNKKIKNFHWGIALLIFSELRVQAGPEIKGEATSPSWENREKFAAPRQKCLWTEDT